MREKHKVGTVARRLGLSRYQVHNLIKDNAFPHTEQTSDGTWLIPERDVARVEAERKANPPKAGRPRTKESK